MSLAEAKNDQGKFKSKLGKTKRGSKKSKEQKNSIYNIELLYSARNNVIKLYDDYCLMSSEAKKQSN